MENDMTTRFFCIFYSKANNSSEIDREGMDPSTIWEIMGYQAFSDDVVHQIIRRLVRNNELRGMLVFKEAVNRVILSDEGRRWGNLNCRRWL